MGLSEVCQIACTAAAVEHIYCSRSSFYSHKHYERLAYIAKLEAENIELRRALAEARERLYKKSGTFPMGPFRRKLTRRSFLSDSVLKWGGQQRSSRSAVRQTAGIALAADPQATSGSYFIGTFWLIMTFLYPKN